MARRFTFLSSSTYAGARHGVLTGAEATSPLVRRRRIDVDGGRDPTDGTALSSLRLSPRHSDVASGKAADFPSTSAGVSGRGYERWVPTIPTTTTTISTSSAARY